jgi:hypothetical protein
VGRLFYKRKARGTAGRLRAGLRRQSSEGIEGTIRSPSSGAAPMHTVQFHGRYLTGSENQGKSAICGEPWACCLKSFDTGEGWEGEAGEGR